ncbi:DUF3761 domain-containing protein [Paraburkholderia sp. J76]|uniref:DUF3761 domain-containing protein n=1 Tax=Paraburkholderia sp. J76 TaxID=2805439 RepID=UPI002ABDE029|nr:DUF3761 domain-containing protein [Paraburkholderia sp. J76]
MTTRLSARLAAAAFALCLAAPAFAFQPSPGTYAAPDESDLDNHRGYVNRDGQAVHSPAHTRSGRAPEGASAQCRDGTYSFSRHHSGTCSRHGGVAQWL